MRAAIDRTQPLFERERTGHGLSEHHLVYPESDREPWGLGRPICNYGVCQARQSGSEPELSEKLKRD